MARSSLAAVALLGLSCGLAPTVLVSPASAVADSCIGDPIARGCDPCADDPFSPACDVGFDDPSFDGFTFDETGFDDPLLDDPRLDDAFLGGTSAGTSAPALIAEQYSEADRVRFELPPQLRMVDTDGTFLPAELKARQIELSGAVITTLGAIPEVDLRAVEDGKQGVVDSPPYLAALNDALYRGGRATGNGSRAELPVNEIVALLSSLGLSPDTLEDARGGTSVAVPPPAELAMEASEAGAANGSLLPIVLGASAAALLVVGAIVVLVRRRHPPADAPTTLDTNATPSADPGPGMAALLDASRRMTGALERAEVAAIAVAVATSITEAEGGAFLAYDGGIELVAEVPRGLVAVGERGGVLQRVAETGQPTYAVTTSDPDLVTVPIALAAVPVIASGSVAGVLMVVRSSTHPFDSSAIERLGMLAPMIGSALAAASTHESVAEMAHVDGLTRIHNRRRLDRDLPGTDAVEATEVAERVRAAIETATFKGEEQQPDGRVTVSVGMAEASDDDAPETLTHRADAALYAAKEAGRNQVTVAG